jgi:acetyltransferase-like isoleucine patch superfamily enzyme
MPYTDQPMVRKRRIPIGHLMLFGWLPSGLKRLAYRYLLGYRVGARVKFGFGAVVVGRDVDLSEDVELGMFAVVMGRTIRMGAFSSIGTMSYVACEHIEIGEDARIREQVYVGGPQLPESRFTLGARTIVLQMAFINPTKPVTIGDDSGIGGHCLIFTHGAWLNALDGYPVNYEPVSIGRSVWLPWRVFVMPGASIGDGSVIGANSLVQGTIPPSSLAVGSPARVIRAAPDFPKPLSAEARAAKVAEMLGEFDRYTTYEGVALSTSDGVRTYRRGARRWRLIWWREGDMPALLQRGDTVLAEVPLDADAQRRLNAAGVFWLDLAGRTRSRGGSGLTDELAAFFGRYGIRLPRDGGGGSGA